MRMRQHRYVRFTPGKIKKPPKNIGMRRPGLMPKRPPVKPKPMKVSHVKKIKQAKKSIPISWGPFDFFKGATKFVGGVVGGVAKTVGGVVGSVFGKKRKPTPKPKPKPVVHRPTPKPTTHRYTSAPKPSVYRPISRPTVHRTIPQRPSGVVRKIPTFQVAAEVDPTGGKIRDTARKATVQTNAEKKSNLVPIILVGAAAVGGFLLLRK